ncbi:MAG TPA: hypothetical protein PLY87_02345 [Planctomycetaceae bacterium]|nr:hypothetical protein [Planctomycetaceae bacterium]HQZ63882.1 hypothetical protein [Planctomycetaceae bacterium]
MCNLTDDFWERMQYGSVTPVDAILEFIGDAICMECKDEMIEWGVFDGVERYLCESCAETICCELIPTAKDAAMNSLEFTCELPTFDPAKAWACTSKEYEMGSRESYTENAFRTHCRHQCTNYDELIADLDRDNMYDQVSYQAIRCHVDRMIDAEIISKNLIRADSEDQAGTGE